MKINLPNKQYIFVIFLFTFMHSESGNRKVNTLMKITPTNNRYVEHNTVRALNIYSLNLLFTFTEQ